MLRRVILIVGALTIALMGLFPPWRYTLDRPQGYGPSVHAERFAGYAPIFRPPEPGDPPELARIFGMSPRNTPLEFFSVRIDTTRIAIQMIAALLFFGFLTFSVNPKRGT